ncbi:hypothetical protein D9613_008745 [Agrocybe pediades]|uniref:F-box domain-containing protein n=1 Tax=Agrocybe pediades TaxID=84607 RepID=A0A8H4VR08_9AGAR|nr:hypothetical protein D9613_008745 [Agrocybe pediades]
MYSRGLSTRARPRSQCHMPRHTSLRHGLATPLTTPLDGIRKIISGTKPLPDLPSELHELIVDNLEGEDDALKQCALTCRSFRHSAQKNIFKSIVFDFSNDCNPVEQFLNTILGPSPQIANYVERLTIQDHGFLGIDDTDTDHKPIERDDSLPLVFPLLTNLVDLTLGQDAMGFNFSLLKPSSQSTIMAKCDSLRSLTLLQINDVPMRILNHLQGLETLNLDEATQLKPCHIKHMKLADRYLKNIIFTSVYPSFMARRFGAGSLESLSIDMNRRGRTALPLADSEAVKWLIRGNAESLKVLDVRISGNVPVTLDNDEPMFDVSKMPLLEEFALGGVVCNCETDQNWTPTIDMGWLARHLETIPTGKRLKRITLRPAILGAYLITEDSLDFERLKYFENLIVEKLLSQTESFSIDFWIWEQIGETEPAKELLQKCLPTVQALGVLHLNS